MTIHSSSTHIFIHSLFNRQLTGIQCIQDMISKNLAARANRIGHAMRVQETNWDPSEISLLKIIFRFYINSSFSTSDSNILNLIISHCTVIDG